MMLFKANPVSLNKNLDKRNENDRKIKTESVSV